jgi:uncharacterized OB-fold protein
MRSSGIRLTSLDRHPGSLKYRVNAHFLQADPSTRPYSPFDLENMGPAGGSSGKGVSVQGTVGIPPAVSEESEPFWAAAREGRLLVQRCTACGAQSFPPRGICRSCRSRDTEPVEVIGPGVVYSFTVNYQRWLPDLDVPYAIVLVEFPDHPGVRIPGRLRGCAPEDTAIGMIVQVGFEPGPGGHAVPSFLAAEPA